jgi:hypothetical protein
VNVWVTRAVSFTVDTLLAQVRAVPTDALRHPREKLVRSFADAPWVEYEM